MYFCLLWALKKENKRLLWICCNLQKRDHQRFNYLFQYNFFCISMFATWVCKHGLLLICVMFTRPWSQAMKRKWEARKKAGEWILSRCHLILFFFWLWLQYRLQWIPDSCRLILAYDNSNDGQEMCGRGFLLLKWVKQRPLFESSTEERPTVGVHEKHEFIWQIKSHFNM